MNIELTAHTTKLLHLSVMDLCSIWSCQLCPRNPGLVFWLCHWSFVWVWANHFILLCLPVLPSLLLPIFGYLCTVRMSENRDWFLLCIENIIYYLLFSILTFAKATSQLNNNNMPVHLSVCVPPLNPSWHIVHFGTHLLTGTVHWYWTTLLSWIRKSNLSLPWLPICLQHPSKVLLLILTSIMEIPTIMAPLLWFLWGFYHASF